MAPAVAWYLQINSSRRQEQAMNARHVMSSFLAMIFLVTAACIPQTEVIKLYDNADRIKQDYERLLVISVASDTGTRRRLEELITRHLESADIAAVAGYTETGLKTTLLQDEIDAAARNAGADAILITHIVSVDTRVDIDEGRIDVESECRAGNPVDYFLYEHRELKEPDSVKVAHTVVAVSNLYDASDGERLWTIQSTCFEKASMDEVLQEEARAIVRQLQIDKLVS
jgi:hypothetical protein